MGSIHINGKTYRGNSIQITNSGVIVDGVIQKESWNKTVDVKVEGTIGTLIVDGNAVVHGDVLGNVDAGNNVQVYGDVLNNVDAGNNVQAETIKGKVDAGNNIQAINMDTRRNWF
jgi:hypothetical protein